MKLLASDVERDGFAHGLPAATRRRAQRARPMIDTSAQVPSRITNGQDWIRYADVVASPAPTDMLSIKFGTLTIPPAALDTHRSMGGGSGRRRLWTPTDQR